MYLPLVMAFNYALERLSSLEVPGLPKFREEDQIVFARSAMKCIKSESYLQGPYKPDIVLVKWNTFKRTHGCAGVTYSKSYESDICYKPGCDQPRLSWRNLLSTLEIKRGGAGNVGNKLPEGKAKGKLAQPMYSGDFLDIGGELKAMAQPRPSQSAPLRMVNEENPTRACRSTTPSSLLTFS